MLANRNQPIIAGLLSLSVAGIVGATALQFNDRIEYKIGNRIESQPAWLVPSKAEFRSVERGYGGIKILLSLLATGGMITVMLIARKELCFINIFLNTKVDKSNYLCGSYWGDRF